MRARQLVLGLFWVLVLAAGISGGMFCALAEPEPVHAVQVVLPSGVRYVDLKIGTGEEAREGKILDVHYTGWIKDGAKFDSTQDCTRPLTLRLGAGDVIKGLDEGLAGMKVGGKRRLTIPPELGFGKEGGGDRIPPDSTLIYEVDLLSVR